MNHKIFTVYDNAVKAYLPPMFLRTRGEAIRAVTEALRDPNHQFAKHSPDYVLFELGEFDDTTGLCDLHSAPESLGVLTEFKPTSV